MRNQKSSESGHFLQNVYGLEKPYLELILVFLHTQN